MMHLIDTHAHLHDAAFDEDRAAVLTRAEEAGVDCIVSIGTDIATSEAAIALAEHDPRVYATAGVHPHDARDWTPAARDQLAALAAGERVVAIGEIGLDFFRNLSPPADQRRAFLDQLALAAALDLPVAIHSRDAHAETYAILREWAPSVAQNAAATAPLPGVIHCFSGDAELALRYVALGFLISFAGPVTYPKNHALQAAARAVPASHLVLETDAPYLSPQSRRGRRNEPALVAETARVIAGLREEPPEDLAAAAAAAARRLYRLPATETIRA